MYILYIFVAENHPVIYLCKKENGRYQLGSLQNHFKKGLSTLAILSLLKRKSMYGYELIQTVEDCSNGLFVLQEGTLYPVLYRLQEQGFIDSEDVLVGKRMRRVYYRLTPAGEEHLARIRKEYDDIHGGFAKLLAFSETPAD